jgi:hypothetical protein
MIIIKLTPRFYFVVVVVLVVAVALVVKLLTVEMQTFGLAIYKHRLKAT